MSLGLIIHHWNIHEDVKKLNEYSYIKFSNQNILIRFLSMHFIVSNVTKIVFPKSRSNTKQKWEMCSWYFFLSQKTAEKKSFRIINKKISRVKKNARIPWTQNTNLNTTNVGIRHLTGKSFSLYSRSRSDILYVYLRSLHFL